MIFSSTAMRQVGGDRLSVCKTNICSEHAINAAECLQSRRKLSLGAAKPRDKIHWRGGVIITTKTDICRFGAAHIAHTHINTSTWDLRTETTT